MRGLFLSFSTQKDFELLVCEVTCITCLNVHGRA